MNVNEAEFVAAVDDILLVLQKHGVERRRRRTSSRSRTR
jgi:hypothetical protein